MTAGWKRLGVFAAFLVTVSLLRHAALTTLAPDLPVLLDSETPGPPAVRAERAQGEVKNDMASTPRVTGKPSFDLGAFEQLPLVKRFRSRGKACKAFRNLGNPGSGFKRKVFMSHHAGFGNVLFQTISIATAASLSDRSLIVQQQPEVINLAGFFGALQEAPLAYEAYLGAQKLEGLLPWTQVVEKLQTHHELAYALGVTWEDLQLALRADIKRTLQDQGAGDAASCKARALYDSPSQELLNAIGRPLANLSSADVLVGVHFRFGDSVILKNLNYSGSWDHAGDVRLQESKWQETWGVVDELISQLEEGSGASVRLTVATDNPPRLDEVERRYGRRLLPQIPSKALYHSYMLQPEEEPARSEYRESFRKMVADWFLLALSDVVVQPMRSSYSDAALLLAMPLLALKSTKPEMGSLRRGVSAVLASLGAPLDLEDGL
ncbi:unnamed protein product [Symbiodinium natans]|uniref:O-fucosyltransferase family protein n=1 Tax=Symbiodinium natans TaxID=878477 RepID=A0A812MJ78_9DINO|nr:unnamed protein product [Symbiodinium natans]